MAEIVNLNKRRKARDKAAVGATAAANRVKHGRNGAARAADEAEAEQRRRLLDGARRNGPDDKMRE